MSARRPAEMRGGADREGGIQASDGSSAAAKRTGADGLFVETSGAGPPLVLLHGFALHGGLLAPLAATLAHRRRVQVIDLPGHGNSAEPAATWAGAEAIAGSRGVAPIAGPQGVPPLAGLVAVAPDLAAGEAAGAESAATLAVLVEAVAAAVMRLGEPAHLLGWSLGGIVAQRLALDRPDLVRSLALVCTTPRFVTAPDWPQAMTPETLARFGDELRIDGRATLQRFLTLQVQGRGEAGAVGRDVLAALRASLLARPVPSPATLAAMLDVLAGTDLRADAARITAPTLVVTGPRDALTPAAAGEWLAGRIPQARHAAIAGAAHAPFLSHPAAFVAAVEGFLDDVDAATLQRA